jgi:hypothetical protein
MTHAWVDLSVVVSENRRVTHAGTGQKKTRPLTTLTTNNELETSPIIKI